MAMEVGSGTDSPTSVSSAGWENTSSGVPSMRMLP